MENANGCPGVCCQVTPWQNGLPLAIHPVQSNLNPNQLVSWTAVCTFFILEFCVTKLDLLHFLLSLVFLQGDFMSFLCLFWFILRQEIVVSFWAPGILKMSFCSSASIIGNICLISFCHVPQNWMTNKCTIVFFFTYLITLLESETEIICRNCMRNIQIYYNLE